MTPSASIERSTSVARYSLRVLVDDVEQFQHFSIPGCVKLKIHCLGHIGIDWVMSSHSNPVTCSFVLTFAKRDLQARLPP